MWLAVMILASPVSKAWRLSGFASAPYGSEVIGWSGHCGRLSYKYWTFGRRP